MSNISFRIAALALFAALAGCADLPRSKDAMLTFETVPEGATIFEGGQALGVAPVTRTYKNDSQAATLKTPEVTAVWPSGAKESFWTMLPAGADRVATIERPKGAPGLQTDLEHAKKVAQSKERDVQRNKEAMARDVARNSQRCKDQMAKGALATNDC